MRKSFTLLFAALLSFAGVAKAGVTDLPQMSEGENIKWYTIKNTRSGKYASYAGDAAKMTQVSTPSLSSLFYFTASDAETTEGFTPVMIHNAATTNKLADYTSWTEAGVAWFLSVDAQSETAAGLHVTKSAAVGEWNGQAGWNALNDEGKTAITNYCALDAGSIFVIEAVEAAKISELVGTYKTAAIDALKTLGTAIDVATAETAINAVAVEGGNLGKFMAEIDAVVNNATQYVTFRNTDTKSNSRVDAYLAAYIPSEKGHGTKTFNRLNAVWSLKYTGNASFYIYNASNKVYLGDPNSNGTLTTTPIAVYTFELVEANVVELKSGGQTLHLNNNNGEGTVSEGNFLSNYDYDDPASRWYISAVDITADLQALIVANAENHAEVPALGQYTTKGYNALVAAKSTIKSVEEVDAAIAAFQTTLNRPVYFITSMHDGYAAGSAIYFDGAWKWKKPANIYDKRMWMTIPGYTEENVPVVDAYDATGTSYAICDFLTGTKMRGKDVQIVKIAEWEGAYNLQYNADGNSTDAAQHAKDNGQLVNWKPATKDDSKASAWRVEYMGESYDLSKLTSEHATALVNLQDAYEAKVLYADAVLGEALGQYKGTEEAKAAIVAVLNDGKAILDATLVEQAKLTVEAINAAAAAINEVAVLAINLPEDGKYYRIQGACDAEPAGHYITGQTNWDGGRIALAATADASTIYGYIDGKLQAYQSGKCIGLSSSHFVFADDTHPASEIEFAASSYVVGAYTIKSADRYLHYKVYDGAVEIDRCVTEESANDAWYVVEVTELPVLNITLNKSEVELTAKGDTVHLAAIAAPDNATEKEVSWTSDKPEVATVDDNGVVTAVANGEATITAIVGNVSAKCVVKVQIIADEDPTGIENLEAESDVVIYDLSGRRVEKMTKGLYIVNGKKVLVK